MNQNRQPQIIILLGRSGSGKGTQAKLLQKEFNFDYISSGDLLRERMKKNDFSGQKLAQILKQGQLAPTFLMFQLWSEKIRQIKNKLDLKGVIIDGSPRSLLEAELMDDAFDWYEWSNIKVILLDISEAEAFERLTKRRICEECGRLIPWLEPFRSLKRCDKCGGELKVRFDDQPEAIRARLEFYKKEVEPAIAYYQKQGRLIKVDGEKPIDDVYQEVKKVVS